MIRSVFCRSDLRLLLPIVYRFSSGFARKEEIRLEKHALKGLTSNEFGSLKVTQDSYLQSESIADDDDNYDTLEISRKKRDQFYHRNMLTRLIHSKPVRLREALQLFDEMQKIDRRAPESTHFTLLITGCAKVGNAKKAFELFDLLLKDAFKPTRATITSLFNACSECRNRELAIEKANFLRDWIFQNSYVCNAKQFNAMIKAYARQGDMKTAFELMNQMVDAGHATTAETFNMLLMGCISNKENGFLFAVKIIRQMISHRCPLNVYTYNLLLRSVRDCELGSKEHLNDFFMSWTADAKDINSVPTNELLNNVDDTSENMKKLPFKVDYENNELMRSQINKTPTLLSTALSLEGHVVSINYESLNEAPNRLQLLGGSEGILEHMKSNNVQPTIATFSLLLESSHNNLEEETKLLSFMQEHKVKPKTDFFNQIIKRRSMRGDISAAIKGLIQMQALSLVPDVVTFGVLAMGCQTKKLGLKLIEDMESAGYTLNIETIGALIKNACMNHNFDYLLALMRVVSEKQIAVNSRVIENLVLSRLKVRDMLLRHEKYGTQLPKKYLSVEFNENFRKFNLHFKKWLKRVNFEAIEDEDEQHNFNFSKPFHEMYLFEKLMREKMRDRINKEINSL